MNSVESRPRVKVAPSGASPLAAAHAPSVRLPLGFIVTGVLALAAGVCLLVIRPDVLATYHYNQYIISITHLFVLGWICTIVMGAVYQLVPVALETRLFSERLAIAQFVVHVVGVAGMVWMFWTWNMTQVGHFGSVFAVGVVLFLYNIARTLLRVPRFNVIAAAVTSTLFWLGCTVLAGLTIVAGKCAYDSFAGAGSNGMVTSLLQGLSGVAKIVGKFDAIGAMHAHAHLGVLGVFLTLIVGVSYRLIPMFTLSELQSSRRAFASILLLNAGVAVSFICILLRSQWKPAGAAIVLAGLLVYGIEIRAILRARKRRSLDWGVRYFLTAIGLLVPLALLGGVLSWPALPLTAVTGQLENLYGFLAIAGVVSFAIIGMLYKIVPFVVWYSCYSKQIGLRPVPALADLYSHSIQRHGYWAYLAGLAIITVGIVIANALVVRIGSVILAFSVAVFLVNISLMFSHFFRAPCEAASSASTSRQPAPGLRQIPLLSNE